VLLVGCAVKVHDEPALLKWFDRANEAMCIATGAGTAASILTSWHSWVWLVSFSVAWASAIAMWRISRVLKRPLGELRRRGIN
jgi:hypothetical protein